jgi:hypothetical protein
MNKSDINFIERFGVDIYRPEKDGLLYKYFSFPRALQAITESKLYFASPTQLNDSFELDIDNIRFEMTDENVKKLAERYYPNNPVKQTNLFEKSITNRRFVPDALRKELDKIRNQSGVCCFTTEPRNKLMWGHYGVSDTGVCIGFNLSPLSISEPELFIMKVKYENERKIMNYFDTPFNIFPLWAFVKNGDWGYEKEIRAINMTYNGLMSYNKESIKEVHYGLKTTEEDIGKMESLLVLKNYHDYKRFKIEKSKTDYKLTSSPF